jgi:hypothetical protein
MLGKIIYGDIADYRLNQLGIRVCNGTCQLISRIDDKWYPMGPRWQLPVQVPKNAADLPFAHALSVTAYQFCNMYPDSDLMEVLTVSAPTGRRRRGDLFVYDRSPHHVSPPSAIAGDPISSSRALIRSSRELLDARDKEPA